MRQRETDAKHTACQLTQHHNSETDEWQIVLPQSWSPKKDYEVHLKAAPVKRTSFTGLVVMDPMSTLDSRSA